tara:strand:+ start:32 stop:538 length:507 start_codon:yes stop_codon:yes gene_type:complete
MAGIHLISSSKFIQSGSVAHFKNGITASLSLSSLGAIYSNQFIGMSTSTETSNEPNNNSLNVGKALENGTFDEWVIEVGESARITASGNFSGFCFVENTTLTTTGNSSTWKTVSKGDGNGLFLKPFYERIYTEAGVYEYLIIANNSSSLQTVVKGTTVTVVDSIIITD